MRPCGWEPRSSECPRTSSEFDRTHRRGVRLSARQRPSQSIEGRLRRAVPTGAERRPSVISRWGRTAGVSDFRRGSALPIN